MNGLRKCPLLFDRCNAYSSFLLPHSKEANLLLALGKASPELELSKSDQSPATSATPNRISIKPQQTRNPTYSSPYANSEASIRDYNSP